MPSIPPSGWLQTKMQRPDSGRRSGCTHSVVTANSPHQGFEEVHTIKVPIAVEDIIDLPLMDDALEEAQDEWGGGAYPPSPQAPSRYG